MKKKNSSRLNLIVFVLVIVVNYLTATGMISGIAPQKEVSRLYETPITPAGFAFSIWGVIYVLLFAVIVDRIKNSPDRKIGGIEGPLSALFIFNILWNIVFGMQWIGISLVMIAGYWISLIIIGYRMLHSKTRCKPIFPIAFGIHTGWITIAGVVNLYAFFVKIQWSGILTNPEFWAIVGIVFTVMLVALLQIMLRNAVLPLATAWAFFGIYAKEGVSYVDYPFIPGLLLGVIAVLTVFAVVTFVRNKASLLPV